LQNKRHCEDDELSKNTTRKIRNATGWHAKAPVVLCHKVSFVLPLNLINDIEYNKPKIL
jgi:hypothetical protein